MAGTIRTANATTTARIHHSGGVLYAMAAIAAGAARHRVIRSKPLCGKRARHARMPGADLRVSAPLANSDNSQRQNSLTSGF